VSAALLAEPGTRALPTPASEAALLASVPAASAAQKDAIASRARRLRTVRLFAVTGVTYVLFFDDERKLRDFVVLKG
jgi:hypothetical protein